VVETIEDFMLHAPLKNIRVELKQSKYKSQGFSTRVSHHKGLKPDLIRTHEKEIEKTTI
jgi:hypothetical protein